MLQRLWCRVTRPVGLALLAGFTWLAAYPGAQQNGGAPQCSLDGPVVRVADLPEASGLAASRRIPGRLWAHNDSGAPALVALDTRGAVTGRVTVSGAAVEDWEAVAVGPCPAGTCIHVGDIGDNDGERERITIYRIPESEREAPAAAEVFHGTYPDGPHDAETLLVSADGRAYIVTKSDSDPVALYAFPRQMQPGSTVRLERIGARRESGGREPITDGAISPDGRWVVLRTQNALLFYPAAEFLEGRWRQAGRVDLRPLGEPQGEGVAVAPDGAIYLAGEGGAGGQPGSFARLTCTASR